MATKKQGLQKDVFAIFGDGSLPQDFAQRRPEVGEATQEKGAKAAPTKRGRKTAASRASAPTGVVEPPKEKKPSSRRAASKKKRRKARDAAADATEKISLDSAETGILDPPPRIADETPEKEPTSVESRRVESPVEAVDTSQAVDESSIDVELPADTTVETDDRSPAPTKEAEAEETGTCDQDENSAQVTTKPPRSNPKESPPPGSIAFLERVKKALQWCARIFTGAP